MGDIWLMRHAAYEGHQSGYHAPPDAPLSPEGYAQIRRALPLPSGITGIITSPLLRARQTAQTLQELTSLPILATSDLLAEWRTPSIIQGRTSTTYPPAYSAWRTRRTTHPTLAYEDGESLAALHLRAYRGNIHLRKLASQQHSLLVVSHKLLLGVLLHLHRGPAAFNLAARTAWPFAHVRRLPMVSLRGT